MQTQFPYVNLSYGSRGFPTHTQGESLSTPPGAHTYAACMNQTGIKQLAVCGWDEYTAALVDALAERTDLRPVAIGDDRPASLVRARAATGLPCYQHLREMLRAADYDAVLIGTTVDRESLVELTAMKGAALLIRGDVANADTLSAAAAATIKTGNELHLVRPELQRSGIDLLMNLVGGNPAWTPTLVAIELTAANGTRAALQSAAALALRLQGATATQAFISEAGYNGHEALLASVQIRHGDRALTTLLVRPGSDEACRVTIETPAGMAELVARDGNAALDIFPLEGDHTHTEFTDEDLMLAESTRIANATGTRIDEVFAPHEAALLRAIESSLATGFVAPVQDPGTRGSLRILEGGDHTTSRRRGHLHLIDG